MQNQIMQQQGPIVRLGGHLINPKFIMDYSVYKKLRIVIDYKLETYSDSDKIYVNDNGRYIGKITNIRLKKADATIVMYGYQFEFKVPLICPLSLDDLTEPSLEIDNYYKDDKSITLHLPDKNDFEEYFKCDYDEFIKIMTSRLNEIENSIADLVSEYGIKEIEL